MISRTMQAFWQTTTVDESRAVILHAQPQNRQALAASNVLEKGYTVRIFGLPMANVKLTGTDPPDYRHNLIANLLVPQVILDFRSANL